MSVTKLLEGETFHRVAIYDDRDDAEDLSDEIQTANEAAQVRVVAEHDKEGTFYSVFVHEDEIKKMREVGYNI